MLLDDIHLFQVEIKIPLRILKCSVGMSISVETALITFDMPVIKEIVMKKSTSYKALLVDLDAESLFKEAGIDETELGNGYDMLIYAGMTMLDKLFHLLCLFIG